MNKEELESEIYHRLMKEWNQKKKQISKLTHEANRLKEMLEAMGCRFG